MRPKSIVTFERIVLTIVALGIVNGLLTREQTAATAADAGMGPGAVLGIQIVGIAVNLLLMWFIARKASPVAKWIYVVLTAIGLVGGLAGVAKLVQGGALSTVLTIVTFALSAVSLYFLFRPDANAWFNDGRGTA